MFSLHKLNNLKMPFCSDLLCGALLPVGGRGGCDVAYGGCRVRAVASRCSTGLWGDGGRWHVADQPRTALHSDVWVPLSGHIEDAEAVVVEARQLALEHGGTSLTSANAHRRLAVEDGQLATYTHTNKRMHTKDTQARQEERWTDTRKYNHTHIHTSGHIRAYIHTHKSV